LKTVDGTRKSPIHPRQNKMTGTLAAIILILIAIALCAVALTIVKNI
jgi:hypothetical protein